MKRIKCSNPSTIKNKIYSSKFETKCVLVDKYDEIVCDLEKSEGDMYYKLPDDITNLLLMDGDVFRVKEVETEIE